MKTRLITYADGDQWNAFVASTPACPLLQSFEWGELKSKFGWTPLRIAVEDSGKIIAGVSILKREIPYIKHSVFYAPRGPAVNFSNRELVEFLLGAIEEQAEIHKAISLKMDPEIPDVPEEQSDIISVLRKLGFVKARKQIQPRATLFLDLRPELDEIMKNFEEKARYNVRLAQRKGVVVQENKGERGINLFYEMYKETAERDKFMIHPVKYYQLIREILLKNGLGTCFVAYYREQPIASVIVFKFGSRVWYMYGASRSEHRKVMPNHLLHWNVIQWAKERRCQTYDLWGIPVNPKEGHPLWGVYRFKKGFNGKKVKFIGAYDFPYSPLFYNLFEYGTSWWKNINSLIKKGRIEDSLGE